MFGSGCHPVHWLLYGINFQTLVVSLVKIVSVLSDQKKRCKSYGNVRKPKVCKCGSSEGRNRWSATESHHGAVLASSRKKYSEQDTNLSYFLLLWLNGLFVQDIIMDLKMQIAAKQVIGRNELCRR